MSTSNPLPVEPWCVREPELDLERMGQMESLFALSNGHIGLRGNLDEGEPYHSPGSFLSGFYAVVGLSRVERPVLTLVFAGIVYGCYRSS